MRLLINTFAASTALILFTQLAKAEGFSPLELVEASRVAMESFLTENPDQAEFITGVKSWKSAADSKVKIYITHHGGHAVEVNYSCTKDQANKVSCSED